MSRRWFRVVVASVSLAAWSGTATARTAPRKAPQEAAQEAPPESPPAAFGPPPPGYEPPPPYTPGAAPEAPPEVEVPPTFMTLDRMDLSSRFGLQIGFIKAADVALSDGFLMRFNPYGQYVFPGKPAGIYAQIPISHAFAFDGADSTGWGNLEMGGFFMPTHSSELILRAGLVAATGSDAGLDALTGLATTAERLTDFVLVLPNSTTARLSASTVQQIGQAFFRADGGFDLVIDRPSVGLNSSVLFRANAAAGIRLPGVDLAFELANLVFVNGDVAGGGITDRFNHTAAISARTTGEDQLHLGTVFPLDSGARGEVWILSIGYQRAMN